MKGQHLPAAVAASSSALSSPVGLGRPLTVLLILVAFVGRTVKMDGGGGGMMVPRAVDS